MTARYPLAESFLARAHDPALDAVADPAALEATLAAVLASARARWIDVAFDGIELAGALGERWVRTTSPAGVELPPFAADLCLAHACLRGDPAAVRSFHRETFEQVDRVLRRLGITAADADDVKQEVRMRILVGGDDAKLAQYTGGGPLAHWVASVAGRAALSLHRRRHGRTTEPIDDHTLPDEGIDPQLDALHARHRADFKQAFQAAVAGLPPRERAVLRALIVDDRSVGDVAALYQIHRVTASRWLAEIRRTLLRETRRWLKDRLQLDASSLDSAMRVLDSQLDVSLYRLLAADP